MPLTTIAIMFVPSGFYIEVVGNLQKTSVLVVEGGVSKRDQQSGNHPKCTLATTEEKAGLKDFGAGKGLPCLT